MAAYVVRDVPGASAAGPVRRPDASWPAAEPRQAARPSAVAHTCPCCDGSDAPAKGSVNESDESTNGHKHNRNRNRTQTKKGLGCSTYLGHIGYANISVTKL